MRTNEILAKSILSPSRISTYAVNPYVGCRHACVYCYAKFMKRFTGHREPWGDFVDIKINAPELLAKEVRKKKKGGVWISGVCDPYQPAEKRYLLTRRCLEILVDGGWPLTIQTKSPLLTRDIDLLRQAADCEAGLSITTADDAIRRIFEPGAPPIAQRIEALARLHAAGIRTFAMIAPLLPGAEGLLDQLAGIADQVLIDRLNYHYADRIFAQQGLQWALAEDFFRRTAATLRAGFQQTGTPCRVLF